MGLNDDLEIRSGGVVAVDTASLRRAAARVALLGGVCAGIHDRLGAARAVLGAAGIGVWPPSGAAEDVAVRAAHLADALRHAADVYELIELAAAEAAARAGGDETRAAEIAAQRRLLFGEDPRAAAEAAWLELRWREGRHTEFLGQLREVAPLIGDGFGVVPATGAALLGAVGLLGRGAIPEAARLVGDPRVVTVQPLRSGPTTAPAGLAAIAGRMPGAGQSRVRVETYTMRDGSRQFVAYVAGTQGLSVHATEPWDMRSNAELYLGERSHSYDATVRALHAAGAGAGDPVHLVGYSQGGMIATRIALEGEFTVPTLVTFGSPVQGDVGDGTVSIALRHTDDPFSALADGGFAAGSGAPGSFVAERVADPAPQPGDLRGDAHDFGRYTETAGMLDASSDPRMDAVRSLLAGLGTAASVEAVVYGAVRGGGAGGASGGVRVSAS